MLGLVSIRPVRFVAATALSPFSICLDTDLFRLSWMHVAFRVLYEIVEYSGS